MRVPLAVNLESRDGTVAKDARILNGIVEVKGEQTTVRKRPGLLELGLVKTGAAQLLYYWNGVKAIIGDYLNSGSITTILSAPVQTNLSPTTAGQQFSAQDNGSNSSTPRLLIHNQTQAWTVNQAGVVSSVTLPVGLGSFTFPITSITRVSTTATATVPSDPIFDVGQVVTIAGATPSAYNGAQTVTAVVASHSARLIPITITRSGTTATATSATPHGLTNGSTYTVSGANESGYNIAAAITVVTTTTFTYTVTLSGGSSAITGTWSTTDKNAGVVLSGSNLIATITSNNSSGSSTFPAVRGTVGKSSGTAYWEVTCTSIDTANNAISIGVANSSMPLTDYVGEDVNSWGIFSAFSFGGLIHNTSTLLATPVLATGDVVGIGVDVGAGTASFYLNRVFLGKFSGLTGTIYPVIACGNNVSSGPTTSVLTGNFSGAFTYDDKDPHTPATGSIIVTDPARPASFTFTIGGSPATPATGTLSGSYVKNLVPGIAYLDGTFYIMDETGVVYNSTATGDDPTTWPALGFITAQNENGGGVAIAKSQGYVIALKEFSSEFFYDAQNAVGSPLSPVQNGFTQIGCASGDSLASLDGTLLWLAQTRQRGRSVYAMTGLQQQKISTPDVERILNADDLAIVRATAIRVDGHSLYLLTLETSDITLCYDLTSQMWTQWSSLSVTQVNASAASVTRSGSTVTVTMPGGQLHSLLDGDPLQMSGCTQPEYNGFFQATYVSSSVFTYQISTQPVSPATGTPTFTSYMEGHFIFTKYADCGGADLFLHETNGRLYRMLSVIYQDSDFSQSATWATPINFMARSTEMDGGSLDMKKMADIQLVADQVTDAAMVRWSDNDYVTHSTYRALDLSSNRPMTRRCGAFRSRSIELKHTGNTPQRWQALELDVGG